MSVVDLLVVLLGAGAVYLGWQRGAVVALVAAGSALACGMVAATTVAALGSAPPAFGLLVGGLLGLVPVAAKLESLTSAVDAHVHGAARVVDRVLGAGFNVVVLTTLGWFVAAVVSVLPGSSGALHAVRASNVLGGLVAELPPEGALGAVVLRSGLVPGLNGPLVLAERVDPDVVQEPAIRDAAASVFEVRSVGCPKTMTGSAWVVGAGLVATNAHVVAGGLAFELSRGFSDTGPVVVVPARVVAFDAANDVAILAVEGGLAAPVLASTTGFDHGEDAAAIGFPGGGPLTVSALRLDRTASYAVEPVGGGDPVPVPVLGFRGTVRSGSSGGPIVDTGGRVVGMVVARAVGQRHAAGYGVPATVVMRTVASVRGDARSPVSTGGCIADLAPGRS